MDNLKVIEVRGQRVLTTKQIAELYKTKMDYIKFNFRKNKDRFVLGKHYIVLEGEELRTLKRRDDFQPLFKQAKCLHLWTEKGALLHAKSINTDKAWEVYDYLVDHYFRSEEIMKKQAYEELCRQQACEKGQLVVNVPENHQMAAVIDKIKDDLTCMNVLLDSCKKYIPEKEYLERRHAALGVLNIIMDDFAMLVEMKPILDKKTM